MKFIDANVFYELRKVDEKLSDVCDSLDSLSCLVDSMIGHFYKILQDLLEDENEDESLHDKG